MARAVLSKQFMRSSIAFVLVSTLCLAAAGPGPAHGAKVKDPQAVVALAKKVRGDKLGHWPARDLEHHYGVSYQTATAAKAHLDRRARTWRTRRNGGLALTVAGLAVAGVVKYAMPDAWTTAAQGRSGDAIVSVDGREGDFPFRDDTERVVIRLPDGRTETIQSPDRGLNRIFGVTVSNGGNTVHFLVGGNGWGGDRVEMYSADRKPDGTFGAAHNLGRVSVTTGAHTINSGTDIRSLIAPAR